jgi:hypothetical protein
MTLEPDDLNLVQEVTGHLLAALEERGIEAEDIAQIQKAARFTWPEQVIELGQVLPETFGPFIAFDAFEGDCRDPLNDHMPGDVRIYCMPRAHVQLPFVRLKMNRAQPTGTRFTYPNAEAFAREIAAEWNGIIERLSGDDDDDSVECSECHMWTELTLSGDDERETPEPTFCSNCNARLPVEATPVEP